MIQVKGCTFEDLELNKVVISSKYRYTFDNSVPFILGYIEMVEVGRGKFAMEILCNVKVKRLDCLWGGWKIDDQILIITKRPVGNYVTR